MSVANLGVAGHIISVALLFGSFARGTQRRTCDIDLLVATEVGRTLLDLIALERSLGQRLGRRVDIITERSTSPPELKLGRSGFSNVVNATGPAASGHARHIPNDQRAGRLFKKSLAVRTRASGAE